MARTTALVLGLILGGFLIIRAVVELFIIDFSDPSTYEHDWGGPTLFGVLLVHCGLGVIAIVIFVIAWRRRRSSRPTQDRG